MGKTKIAPFEIAADLVAATASHLRRKLSPLKRSFTSLEQFRQVTRLFHLSGTIRVVFFEIAATQIEESVSGQVRGSLCCLSLSRALSARSGPVADGGFSFVCRE
jgi:hypothetical protein